MKRSTFLLMGVGLAVVAGGLFAFGYRMATDTVSVVTAKSFIPADTPVQAGELTTTQVPRSFARQMGALTRAGDVTGHYLSVSVVPGEPITQGMLATSDDLKALASQYAAEHHTDGVLVDYPANSALANAAQPGQDVALVVTPQGQNAVPKLYPVHVLAVSAPQTQQSSPLSLNNNSSGKTLFLFVPHNEYTEIAPALSGGQARVVFLPSTGQADTVQQSAIQPNSEQSSAVHSGIRPSNTAARTNGGMQAGTTAH